MTVDRTNLLFVTGTGTGVGKTWLSVALIRAWRERGHDVLAVKPFETGCDPDPRDAIALAEACGKPHLAHLDGFLRARLPVAPAVAGEPIHFEAIDAHLESLCFSDDGHRDGAPVGERRVLIEGAGGPLVPLTRELDIADWASGKLDSVVLVAANRLGVLSHTFTAVESLQRRQLPLLAVVLNASADVDPSQETNLDMLRARLDVPVFQTGWGAALDPAFVDLT